MSYDSKIAQVKSLIDTHNSNVDDSSEAKVDFDKFMGNLRKLGGTSEHTLKSVSWEDLQSCGLPVILARTASKIFRQEEDGNGSKSGWVSPKMVQQMSIRDLLERYDPSESDTSVAKRLSSISKGKKCIVFNNNGKVVIEASAQLIEDIKQGLPSMDTYVVDGVPTLVYEIGRKPDQFFDENPIFPGRVLRSGQICDQTNRSWDGVPLIIRQLLWVAVSKTGELRINGAPDAHDVMDKVVVDKVWDEKVLRTRFIKASLAYDELVKTNQVPMLKVSLGSSKSSKKDSPFGSNTTF